MAAGVQFQVCAVRPELPGDRLPGLLSGPARLSCFQTPARPPGWLHPPRKRPSPGPPLYVPRSGWLRLKAATCTPSGSPTSVAALRPSTPGTPARLAISAGTSLPPTGRVKRCSGVNAAASLSTRITMPHSTFRGGLPALWPAGQGQLHGERRFRQEPHRPVNTVCLSLCTQVYKSLLKPICPIYICFTWRETVYALLPLLGLRLCSTVYPRVCGGTEVPSRDPPSTCGLSPRVRGNRPLIPESIQRTRSIPACAGEPWSWPASRYRASVYPRVCGGTA